MCSIIFHSIETETPNKKPMVGSKQSQASPFTSGVYTTFDRWRWNIRTYYNFEVKRPSERRYYEFSMNKFIITPNWTVGDFILNNFVAFLIDYMDLMEIRVKFDLFNSGTTAYVRDHYWRLQTWCWRRLPICLMADLPHSDERVNIKCRIIAWNRLIVGT